MKLVFDGTFSQDYKQAVQNISQQGMEDWIRNMFNDPDYFESDGKTDGSQTPMTRPAAPAAEI